MKNKFCDQPKQKIARNKAQQSFGDTGQLNGFRKNIQQGHRQKSAGGKRDQKAKPQMIDLFKDNDDKRPGSSRSRRQNKSEAQQLPEIEVGQIMD